MMLAMAARLTFLFSLPERLLRTLAALLGGTIHETAELEVSTGIGLAFFNSARHVGRQHLLDPYREDLQPLRDEGFGAYAARVARPYGEAVARHLDGARPTLTERGIDRLRDRSDT